MIQSYKKVAEEFLSLAGIEVERNNTGDIQIHIPKNRIRWKQ